MNILFLSFIPVITHYGGIQRVTDNLSKEFRAKGHNVIYAYYEKRVIPEGYKFSCKQYFIDVNKKDKNTCLPLWNNILDTNQIDCIINQQSDEISCFLLKNRKSNVKVVTVFHVQPFAGLEFFEKQINARNPRSFFGRCYKLFGSKFPHFFVKRMITEYTKTLKMSIDVSDKICLFSEGYLSRIKRYMEIEDESKFCIIPNPNSFDLAQLPQLNLKCKKILYVGRLENSIKNISSLLNVWKDVSKRAPEWMLTIVGDGPDMKYLMNLCKDKCIKNIVFEGYKEDVKPYYLEASIICMTSFHESWAMSLLEGMNYGCIPVAFNTYEALQLFVTPEIGLLIDPFNENKMSDEIVKLILDDKRKKLMSVNAYYMSKKFTASAVAEKWLNLLNSL